MDEELKVLVQPFFEDGAAEVYTATCCRKTYVGRAPVNQCSSCKSPVASQLLTPDCLRDTSPI
jgi:hypothetical protein